MGASGPVLFSYIADVVIVVLCLCILFILHRLYGYVQKTANQLKGIQEASMEMLQQSLSETQLGLQKILYGFWIFFIHHIILAIRYGWNLRNAFFGNIFNINPLDLLIEGASISLITYGFILYVNSLERNKPAALFRPFDRVRFNSRFPNTFRTGALAAILVAAVLTGYWILVDNPTFEVVIETLFSFWQVALLGLAINHIRWSNLGIVKSLTTVLLLWALSALFEAAQNPAFQKGIQVIVMVGIIRVLNLDNILRLSDLAARSAKISHDKNIILSFLTQLAVSGEDTEALEGSFDPRRLMQSTLDFAIRQTQASAGAIFLVSETNPNELFAAAVQGTYPPQQDLAAGLVALKEKHIADLVLSERIPIGKGVVGEAAERARPIRIDDAGQDIRIRQSRQSFLEIKNQLVAPLKIKDRVEGVISVINRTGGGEFTPPFDVYDEALLLAVGEQASVALSNARMHKILAEQEILEREIQIAQEVQRLLLPKECPFIPGYEMGAYSRSARRVGGDYYDFLRIDSNRLAIVIADVAGKGVPGAITMAMVRSALKGQMHPGMTVRDVLGQMNRFVWQDTKPETFVSMFLAVLNIKAKTITLARAGHEPMIYMPSHNGSPPASRIIAPTGMALGIDSGDLFQKSLEEVEIQLGSGDTLVFYTDGVTEAMNKEGEEFTLERFMDTLQRGQHESSEQLLQSIRTSVSTFTGDRPQHDDLTLVLVKVQ
jgi:phosphoserine phosphatase RsbU/P